MGTDINIYLDIDQDTAIKYINENNLDKYSYIDGKNISNYFYPGVDASYDYDEDLDIHKIYVTRPIKFLRDNKKLNDNMYHKLLEKKHGKKFECKYYDIINMYNKDDIINIIEQLRYWFPYEEDFIWFINWLEKMSEYEIIHIEID